MNKLNKLNRIKILPDNVKKKIAAGEVVEGPFSVVKELLENAIDAGSTQIDVQIFDSGLKKIVIKDDGNGINREDVELAITEHATSKIEDVADIEKIRSYGFRGEALSSISSISRLSILTKSDEDKIGARLVSSEEGITITDYAGSRGTMVIVENLFYNIPARKKFLKAKQSELKYIREIFIKTAIPNPEISFSLDVDNKRHITLIAVSSIEERLEQVYSKGILDNLYHDKLQDIKVTIRGFFSKPDFLKSSRSMQLLYINKRPVEYKYLGYILSRAYEAIAVKGKYPAGILFIDIDPELVDVNIHPAKREVKLFDQRYIDSLINSLATRVLNQRHSINDKLFKSDFPDIIQEKRNMDTSAVNQQELSFNYNKNNNSDNRLSRGLDSDMSITEHSSYPSFIRDVSELYKDIEKKNNIHILGIAFNTYIVLEEGDSLHFIDFHAAHERILYDSLMQKGYDFEVQELMFPKIMELSIEDYKLILENILLLSKIGFDIDDFSDNSITVRAVPEIAKNIDVEIIIKEFIDIIKEEKEENSDILNKITATVACHSAKRSGDVINKEDMELLVNMSLKGGHDLRCPHGRPYVYKIDKNDLERIFKRQ